MRAIFNPLLRTVKALAPHWLSALTALTLATAIWLFSADLTVKYLNACQTFQYAAKALEAGQDLYSSHPPHIRCQYVYPPLFAVIFIPLSSLTPVNATRVWLLISVALTVFAIVAGTLEMMRRLHVPQSTRMTVGLCCGSFWLSIGEIKTEWGTGQTDTLILVAFVLALRWLDRLPWLAGAVLGLAGNIKYQTLVALPWMLVRRRWQAASFVVVSTCSFMLIPALITGWAENLRNLGIAFAGLEGFLGIHHQIAAPTVDVAWIRSISVTSAVARLLETLHGDPARALTLSGLVAVGFLGFVAWIYRSVGFRLLAFHEDVLEVNSRNAGRVAIEWMGLMVACLVFGPEVTRRHMCVLILLHSAVLALLASPDKHFQRKPLVIGLIAWQLGIRLPPSGVPSLQRAADLWNSIGGPSWCLLILYALLVRSGLEWAIESRETQSSTLLERLSVE